MKRVRSSRRGSALPAALFAALLALLFTAMLAVCPGFGPAAGRAWAQGLSGPGVSAGSSVGAPAPGGVSAVDLTAGWFFAAVSATPDQDFAAGYAAFTGQGVAQDYTLAASRLLRAARAGHQGAQALAGYMNLKGLGLPVNANWAVYWLNLALAHPGISPEERALSEGFLAEAQARQGAKQ